ncbi:MAG: choice-of-anchor Q domain-containing protein [Anaerolineae bacterium]
MTIPQEVLADGIVIYVDRDAPGPLHNGASWQTAFTTVQDALDFTAILTPTSYEIWVAEGVYYPDEGIGHVNNALTETFRIAWNNVELYGGFVGAETLRTQRDWLAHPTILSGDVDGNDTNTDGNFIAETWNDIQGSNAYHVLFLGGVVGHSITETTVIDGFIVTAGNAMAASAPDDVGGGYYCAILSGNAACSPTLTNLVFSGNQARHIGGGIYNFANDGESSPTLTNVLFRSNRAEFGGGMYNGGIDFGKANPILTNVTFDGNTADQRGGGMSNGGSGLGMSNPVLVNVTFSDNSAVYYGGGMYNEGYAVGTNYGQCNATLINTIFSGNQAMNGAGMFNYGNDGTTSPVLTNVTFHDNQATTGGAIYSYVDGNGVSAPTLVNCILWGNTATTGPEIYNTGDNAVPVVTYSNIEWPSGTYTGTGNLNVDPQFIAPTTGNYRLQANSPMIDAGDPNRTTCPAFDWAGAFRNDLRCDMGAFERVYSDGDTVIKTGFTGGVPYSFGPTWVSLMLTAADSGTVTVTKHLAYPGGTQDAGEMRATWWISSSLSAGLPVTLSLCYTDAEVAGLNEAALEMFRWNGSVWVDQNATPDPLNNCVTLAGVAGFSAWTLKDTSVGAATPTVLTLTTLKAARTFGLSGIVAVVSLVGVIALRRKRWQ